jgi:hypothetical protein
MMVKTFDQIELTNELDSIKDDDPFVDLEFDNHEVEREELPTYISDDEETDYSSDTGYPSTQLPPPRLGDQHSLHIAWLPSSYQAIL